MNCLMIQLVKREIVSLKFLVQKKLARYFLLWCLSNLKLVLILPIVTTSVERCFSAMNVVKKKLGNKMSDQFMSNCLICYVEKNLSSTIGKWWYVWIKDQKGCQWSDFTWFFRMMEDQKLYLKLRGYFGITQVIYNFIKSVCLSSFNFSVTPICDK